MELVEETCGNSRQRTSWACWNHAGDRLSVPDRRGEACGLEKRSGCVRHGPLSLPTVPRRASLRWWDATSIVSWQSTKSVNFFARKELICTCRCRVSPSGTYHAKKRLCPSTTVAGSITSPPGLMPLSNRASRRNSSSSFWPVVFFDIWSPYRSASHCTCTAASQPDIGCLKIGSTSIVERHGRSLSQMLTVSDQRLAEVRWG
jgi:hypothetical protein